MQKTIISQLSFLVLCLGLIATGCKKAAGDKAATGAKQDVSATSKSAKAYTVDNTNSKVLWTGSKPAGQHSGTIDVSNGTLYTTNDIVTGGSFTLNMSSLAVTDLKAGDGKENLEGHLKGMTDKNADDFFNVRKYPTATFTITKVEPTTTVPDANFNITGNLKIKDIEKSITFPASIVKLGEKINAVTPSFTINRTEWGINFQSKSVFTDLKEKFINDDISLNIQLEAH